jgi:hypothetical protein
LGDWSALADTRRKYMLEQPYHVNWAGFIFGTFMAKQYPTTLEAIDACFAILKEDKEGVDPIKMQELHLLKAHVHQCMGNVDQAIKYLVNNRKSILDDIKYYE